MTVIWMSPRLPADRSALAASLGPDTEISSAPLPPAGASVAVATVFERPLLEQLAAVPGAGVLLLLKPPGTATPMDLPFTSGPLTVVEAADVAEVATAIRGVLDGPPAPWAGSEAPAATPSGWLLAPVEHPTGELPAAADVAAVSAAGGRSHSTRRNWLASGGIIAAAALAAVVVLATQGGASGTSQTGFRGPGGFGGRYGFGNGSAPGGISGGTGLPGSGVAPGNGQQSNAGSGSDDSTRAAQRQAFLDCLKKNGVDTRNLRQGQRPRLDPSDPTVASAFQACRSLLPRHGDRDGGGMPPGGPGSGGMGLPDDPGGRS